MSLSSHHQKGIVWARHTVPAECYYVWWQLWDQYIDQLSGTLMTQILSICPPLLKQGGKVFFLKKKYYTF